MYTIDEGQLTIPEQWKAETVNVFTSGVGKEQAFSLVITRDEIGQGITFSDYVKTEMINISSNLPKFTVIEVKANYQIDGQSAHYIEYSWLSSEGALYQLVAMTALEQNALTFTASSSNTLTDDQKSLANDMLQSFEFK